MAGTINKEKGFKINRAHMPIYDPDLPYEGKPLEILLYTSAGRVIYREKEFGIDEFSHLFQFDREKPNLIYAISFETNAEFRGYGLIRQILLSKGVSEESIVMGYLVTD